MEIKTSELTEAALDWAVARITNPEWWEDGYMDGDPGAALDMDDGMTYSPSTDWSQGGPIIEREGMGIEQDQDGIWFASYDLSAEVAWGATGPTPLIAAMRCYVASKLGDEVEVPEELQ